MQPKPFFCRLLLFSLLLLLWLLCLWLILALAWKWHSKGMQAGSKTKKLYHLASERDSQSSKSTSHVIETCLEWNADEWVYRTSNDVVGCASNPVDLCLNLLCSRTGMKSVGFYLILHSHVAFISFLFIFGLCASKVRTVAVMKTTKQRMSTGISGLHCCIVFLHFKVRAPVAVNHCQRIGKAYACTPL